MKSTQTGAVCAAVASAVLWTSVALAQKPPVPVMRWGVRVVCTKSPDGKNVRLQCDPKARRCLWTPACEVNASPRCKPLERAWSCSSNRKGLRWADWADRGFEMVRAIGAAPPGWTRDLRGRVFQTNFDLGRRVWIGARWPFTYGPNGRLALGRVGLEAGLRVEHLNRRGTTRWRFNLLESEVMLNPLSVDATLFTIDTSHESQTPLLRLTTFWPEPARHDVHLDVGFWAQIGGVEHRPRGSVDETALRYLALAMTWDLWHDADLTSYVRLRSGAAMDDLYLRADGVGHRFAFTPLVYAEGDLTLDDDGFHHLSFHAGYEAPLVFDADGEDGPSVRARFSSELAYELIVLAINDQPLTLRASVGGGYRDDLRGDASGWDLRAGLGLRFSLWVPPRDLKALRRARKRRSDASEGAKP